MTAVKIILILAGTAGFFSSVHHSSRDSGARAILWSLTGAVSWLIAVASVLWWLVPGFFGGS